MKRLGCLHPLGTPRPLGGPKFHATWSLPSSCRKLPICCFTNGKHASCLLVPWRSRAQFHPPHIPHRRSSDCGYCAKPCGRRLLPCFWVSVSRQLAPPRGCVLAERARSPYQREHSLMPAKFQLLHVLRRYTRAFLPRCTRDDASGQAEGTTGWRCSGCSEKPRRGCPWNSTWS